MHDFIVVLREVNVGLALIAAWLLAWRVARFVAPGQQLIAFLFVLYVVGAGASAAQGAILNAPTGPVTIAFTVLHLTLIFVCRKPIPGSNTGQEAT